MRIVQTFWTGGHNPLEYGFGWPHPEYNLMSWALSCLSLREHYDEVVLYTDSAGKRILIDELRLPYTDVQVVFDDFPCLPQHWALAKIKTYSLQTKPFLHVDGDIYVPRPLPENVLSAPLIAQNREIGTIYYRRMMERILSHPEIQLPDYIRKGLEEESIASYNMGFFGGSDLNFIHRYCDEVFRFMEENRMNDPECPWSRVDCNVFFEQVMFAVMADKEQREVASILGHDMRDNGYTRREFCDLQHYDAHPFHHLLGGHKRKNEIVTILRNSFFFLQPKASIHILSLFPKRHIRFAKKIEALRKKHLVEEFPEEYNNMLRKVESSWDQLSLQKIINIEKLFMFHPKMMRENLDRMNIQCNPHVTLFHIPIEWSKTDLRMVKRQLAIQPNKRIKYIVMIPTIFNAGINQIPISKIGCHIIKESKSEKICSFCNIVHRLSSIYGMRSKEAISDMASIICQEIYYLSQYRIIKVSLTQV